MKRFRGGWLPFGYEVRAGIKITNPAEQALVSKAKELRGNGVTLKSLAEWLNMQGSTRRDGRQWDHNSIYQMLKMNGVN